MPNSNKTSVNQVEQIVDKISWKDAVTIGQKLVEYKETSIWLLGDLALQVGKNYGLDSLGKFATEIGINKNSLQQYRRVSAAFPPNTRSKFLSHRHHLILASDKNRFSLLEQCEKEGITTSQLETKYSRKPQTLTNLINKKELIFQQILDLALEEGKKVVDKYLKEHEQDTHWSVCLGDVYIIGDGEFATWYCQKMNTDIIENQGGYKYEGAMMWASKVQSILSSFGIETRNDIHLD